MSVKVIAVGNVLMKDDGSAIEIAKLIEYELIKRNIRVIIGETDFQYCLSSIEEKDFIILLDAACSGKSPGEVTTINLNNFHYEKKNYTQHSYSFLDLLKLYHPDIKGVVFAVEVKEVEFSLGLSSVLKEKLEHICKEILERIEEVLLERDCKSN
jgi:hydrogenase maturation protease